METTQNNISYAEELVGLRENVTKMLPKEALAIFDNDADELQEKYTDILKVSVGDTAPDFTLTNALDKEIKLSELVKNQKVVLTFYRGNWCPYCNLQLNQFQRALPQIKELGATLVAISPQKPDESLNMKEKNELQFEVLSDVGNQVARKYTTVFVNGNAPLETMAKLGFDFDAFYEDDSRELPIPAVIIIDQNQKVIFAKTEGGDYRNRTEINEIIQALS